MTRINIGIPPKDLHQKHLIAEHREIKRIPNAIREGRANLSGIPAKFTLGTGHVKFFYNKLGYLQSRYKSIYLECIKRGFNVQDYSAAWLNIPDNLMGDWQPTEEDISLIKQRLIEKDSNYLLTFKR